MRLISARRGSALRNRRPTRVRRFVPYYCIPMRVRRFVPRYCIPVYVCHSVPRYCSPHRLAADRHTRAAASCSAFLALCRRTACGVPHFGNVSIYWQKNAGGCPRLFPNCLETFPFFYYSILPLFDFVNPFFSFFSILFTQDCILSPFTCNFRLLYTRQVFFFAQQPSHFTQAAIPKDCPSKAACEVGSPHKQRARSTRCPAITSKRLSTRRLPHLRLPYMCLIKTNDSKLLHIG